MGQPQLVVHVQHGHDFASGHRIAQLFFEQAEESLPV
jgi:hypothetical protein